MASFDDYIKNPEQALIDAATDPGLSQFIEPSDLGSVTVQRDDGTQVQVQALSRKSIRRVVERIIARGRELKINIKDWICSPEEFDLCSKLDMPIGQLMRLLNESMKNKLAQGGLHAVALGALFMNPAVGAPVAASLEIFNFIGFINDVFVELCNCPEKARRAR
jgi:hypothetical protein